MEDRINDALLRRMLGDECESTPACNILPNDGHTGGGWGLVGYPVAMVYAPIQEFENIYERDKALMSGTIFNDLDLPFMGISVTKGGKRCDQS